MHGNHAKKKEKLWKMTKIANSLAGYIDHDCPTGTLEDIKDNYINMHEKKEFHGILIYQKTTHS